METRKLKKITIQGPVVRKPVSANPGLNFNLGFFFLFIKSTLSDNFLYFFLNISNHQFVGKENSTELAFLALISEFKICTNPGLA